MSGPQGPSLEFREDEESSTGTATPKGDPQSSFLESVAEEDDSEEMEGLRVQIDVIDDSGRMSELAEDRRSVNSTRMPTHSVRAKLVRTPANKDEPTLAEPPQEQDEDLKEPRPADVLITELKELPLVEGDEEEPESDVEPEYKQVTVETVYATGSAEEDWDTDLEIEGNIIR